MHPPTAPHSQLHPEREPSPHALAASACALDGAPP
jgi:hypothetical protein